MNKLEEVKSKREFSKLPDSIVKRALRESEGDVKNARALLRKYFGVFLTNKVIKGKLSWQDLLKSHISSKKRNYKEFYSNIFSQISEVNSIIDLGAGANGASYPFLNEIHPNISYLGVEATGQLVEQTNKFFKSENYNATAIQEDLFNLENIIKILKAQEKHRVVFLFQVIDALENLEKNFSKKFILGIAQESEKIVLTFSTESLGGRKKFAAQRKWLLSFLEEHFTIFLDIKQNGERILVLQNK